MIIFKALFLLLLIFSVPRNFFFSILKFSRLFSGTYEFYLTFPDISDFFHGKFKRPGFFFLSFCWEFSPLEVFTHGTRRPRPNNKNHVDLCYQLDAILIPLKPTGCHFVKKTQNIMQQSNISTQSSKAQKTKTRISRRWTIQNPYFQWTAIIKQRATKSPQPNRYLRFDCRNDVITTPALLEVWGESCWKLALWDVHPDDASVSRLPPG